MKLLIIPCLLLLSFSGSAQLLAPVPERSTFVIFREFPSRYGHESWSRNYRITVNKQAVCNLSENRYIVYTALPGPTTILSRPARGLFRHRAVEKLALNALANKVYYIRCDQRNDRTRERLAMTLNDVAKAIPTLKDMKMDRCEDHIATER
jgi:hypothetical protein